MGSCKRINIPRAKQRHWSNMWHYLTASSGRGVCFCMHLYCHRWKRSKLTGCLQNFNVNVPYFWIILSILKTTSPEMRKVQPKLLFPALETYGDIWIEANIESHPSLGSLDGNCTGQKIKIGRAGETLDTDLQKAFSICIKKQHNESDALFSVPQRNGSPCHREWYNCIRVCVCARLCAWVCAHSLAEMLWQSHFLENGFVSSHTDRCTLNTVQWRIMALQGPQ